mgnify:CR=1 FL=1
MTWFGVAIPSVRVSVFRQEVGEVYKVKLRTYTGRNPLGSGLGVSSGLDV